MQLAAGTFLKDSPTALENYPGLKGTALYTVRRWKFGLVENKMVSTMSKRGWGLKSGGEIFAEPRWPQDASASSVSSIPRKLRL